MMNQQMARDESDLENISMKNRPMKIMEDYHLFCSQEWLEAKTTLDEWVEENGSGKFTETDTCTFLTDGIIVRHCICKSSFHTLSFYLLDSSYKLSTAKAT